MLRPPCLRRERYASRGVATIDGLRLAGFGYIITATYLPLFLSGSLQSVDPIHLWALFGLAAAPSCLIWHKLVLKWGTGRR